MENSNSKPIQNQQNSVRIVKCKPVEFKNTRAFVDLAIGPFILRSFSLIETKNGGLWLAPPSNFKKDAAGNSKNFPIISVDETFQDRLSKAVIARYRQELRGAQQRQAPPESNEFQAGDNDMPF